MKYFESACKKLSELDAENALILAIESSCDETAVAITRGREVLSSVIASQIEIHRRFGGVVPEIASRNHVMAIDSVVDEALCKAQKTLKDIDVVAVTRGAGLLGALLVGVSYAKALAFALGVPLVGIDHIKGHIFAAHIANKQLQPPYITLLASGGHTAVIRVTNYCDMTVMGETQDDACGEAFDKVARVLGLPYPGGPQIEKLALQGQPTIKLPRAFKNERDNLNFSYSGLKTAVINLIHNAKSRGEDINAADIARSFEEEATAVLAQNALRAAQLSGIKTMTLAGGVGANARLRNTLAELCRQHEIELHLPPKYLCTDNAAMIGVACYEALALGLLCDDLSMDADPSL